MAIAVSIIIPTLDEAGSIEKTLDAVRRFAENGEPVEIIVVDGASRDETVAIVENYRIPVITAARGRGAQMHAGAQRARGEVLWFLHADAVPPPDAIKRISRALSDKRAVGGNFTIRFDGDARAARFLTWLYPNLRRIGLCYGDSAFFLRRAVYEQIGGFKPIPLFEDADLFKRASRAGRMVNLPAKITASSRRFENRNFTVVFARWMLLQGLYWLGVSPNFLSRLYAPVRSGVKVKK